MAKVEEVGARSEGWDDISREVKIVDVEALLVLDLGELGGLGEGLFAPGEGVDVLEVLEAVDSGDIILFEFENLEVGQAAHIQGA